MNIEVKDGKLVVTISDPDSPQQLRDAIDALAQRRAKVANEPFPPDGLKLQAMPDPVYWIEARPDLRSVVLCFLHPGIGWVAYVLTAAYAEDFNRHVNQQTAVVASAATSGADAKLN